jgi:hypothetical protein
VHPKSKNLLREIKEHLENGTYILTEHAAERLSERRVRLTDVLYVLEKGQHERKKDSFDRENQCWKHAIRGKTIDRIDIRVIVALKNDLVIITVIRV